MIYVDLPKVTENYYQWYEATTNKAPTPSISKSNVCNMNANRANKTLITIPGLCSFVIDTLMKINTKGHDHNVYWTVD